jgi:CIC family chloride channel protein
MESKNWYIKMIDWRENNIGMRQFILILSFFVGILTSTAAFLLKTCIHKIQGILFQSKNIDYWYLLYPVIGISICYIFVRYVVKDNINHGVTRILHAISQRKSIIKLHNIWTSLVGSSLTIGFGGSVGAEAPIVLTGAAMASNLGRFFKMDQKTLMLLIGCGAAGSIGGIFKAPIAGLVFTLEVLMLDMTLTSIIPLLISSVTATSLTYAYTGGDLMFHFSSFEVFSISKIPHLILLGIVCGLVSLYFSKGMNLLEGFYGRFKSPLTKLFIGGSVLCILIYLFPPLYGEGYSTINQLLNQNSITILNKSPFQNLSENPWVIIAFFSLIILFKIFAVASTTSGGGVGGIFAPSLFVGCITGFVTARIFSHFGCNVPEENFALAGMAGLMSGVMHAPLTAIFLIAELTGGYSLFLTLMIVSTISYLTIIIFEPHSLYAMRLSQKGELMTHHKDKAVLTMLKIENFIDKDFIALEPKMTLGELVKIIAQSNHNIYPVLNPNNKKLIGIIVLDDIKNIMFRQEHYNRFTVGKIMNTPPAILNNNMQMEVVMNLFESTNSWMLPIIDTERNFQGFVSKSKIYSSYRHVLVKFSDE